MPLGENPLKIHPHALAALIAIDYHDNHHDDYQNEEMRMFCIIITIIMITNHYDHQHHSQPSWEVGITDESRRSCKKQTSPSTHRGFY